MGAPRPADPALYLRWWLPCLAVPSGPCPSCWAPGCLADARPVPVVLGELLTFLCCGLREIETSLGTENPWHVAQPSLCLLGQCALSQHRVACVHLVHRRSPLGRGVEASHSYTLS